MQVDNNTNNICAFTTDPFWLIPLRIGSGVVVLTQLHFGVEVSELPSEIGIALLECYLLEEGEERSDFDLLEADFFDDECVVILYRLRQRESQYKGSFFLGPD